VIYSRLILLFGFLSTSPVILAQANLFDFGGSYHAGAYSNAVAVADLNGDGKLDLVVASYDTNNVTILLGNGAGTFTESVGSPFAAGARPSSVSLGDFNGDGHPDIALINPTDLVPIGSNGFLGSVRLFLGKGDGQFAAAAGSPFAVPGGIGFLTSSAVALDINRDGRLDLAVAMGSGISVLIGDGAGGFIPAVKVALHGDCINALTAADFNHDGNLDVAFTYSCNGVGVKLGLGDGHGAFGPETMLDNRFILDGPGSIASGDFNGDGIPDLLIGNGGNVTVWYFPASGPYNDPSGQRFFSLGYAGALVTGDFNGDGKLDWAAALSNLNSVAVMLNDGAGGFTPAPGSPYAVGMTPASIAVGDFNGTGSSTWSPVTKMT